MLWKGKRRVSPKQGSDTPGSSGSQICIYDDSEIIVTSLRHDFRKFVSTSSYIYECQIASGLFEQNDAWPAAAEKRV